MVCKCPPLSLSGSCVIGMHRKEVTSRHQSEVAVTAGRLTRAMLKSTRSPKTFACQEIAMKLAVGTYEGSLIGWESDYDADISGRTLSLAYAFSAHDTSIKAVAMSGATLVTGSGDETMKLYNLRTHREIGSLLEHKDAVMALEFFGNGTLLSGDHSGAICIWRTSDWTSLHTMTGHKCVFPVVI